MICEILCAIALTQGMTKATTTTNGGSFPVRLKDTCPVWGECHGEWQLATNKSAACRFVKDLKKRHIQEIQDEGHLKVAFDAQREHERERGGLRGRCRGQAVACQWELMSRISANCCGCQRQAKWATLKALDTFVYH